MGCAVYKIEKHIEPLKRKEEPMQCSNKHANLEEAGF